MSYQLIHGDCLEVMPTLESGSVDMILADIPYGEVNRASAGIRILNKGNADIETFNLNFVIKHSVRLAKSIYIFCGIEQVSKLRKGFVDCGLSTRLLIWEKTNPTPLNGEYLWLSSIECCVFARKSGAIFNEHCHSSVFRGVTEKDQLHPTQKPLWLMRKLIRASTNANGTVLDFCTGSGSTIVAAIQEGRRAIGIEQDAGYFQIAQKRCEEASYQPSLFTPQPTQWKPVAMFGDD